MPYPTIEIREFGDNYSVDIEFSDTHQLMFGTAVGYEGHINDAGIPDDRILFWGDEPNTYLEILNGSYYAEVNAQFYRGSTRIRIPKINWQNWTEFYENVVGGDIPYMTEGEWGARFQAEQDVPEQHPPEEEDPSVSNDPAGGRKRKTRARKIKRRKTYRRKQ